MFHSPFTSHASALAILVAKLVALFCLPLCLVACGKNADPVAAAARHYEVRGIVRGLPPDRSTIEIEHEDIPGFMPRMTMPFAVRDAKEIAQAKVGEAVSFRLNVTERDAWIDQLRKIDPAQVHIPLVGVSTSPPASSHPRLRERDPLPDFHLLDQAGQPLTRESFRGYPLLLTFIFTRCAVPNFCPRMSQNFAAVQKAMQTAPESFGGTRLLSISFDPGFDTPAVLKEYAQHEGADPALWSFATGGVAEVESLTSAFSVSVQPEAGTISHSLATALVDRDGKVAKIWRGNGWTPAEVLEELKQLQATADDN